MTEGCISDNVLRAIQYSVKTETIEIDGVKYATRPVFDLRKEDPTAKPLQVHTLSGLCDYLKSEKDGATFALENIIVHVASHAAVSVIGQIFGHFKQRATFVTAQFEELLGKSFQFNILYDLESFNIALKSLFVPTMERDQLLQVIGNVRDETEVRQFDDDGVTQQVTARAGLQLVANVKVPNPVILQPYRTFREIEQPASKFVFRMKQAQGEKPKCALFEADGGAWKLTAIESIKAYIGEKVTGVTIIG